jgi:hypothetical protein
VAGISHRPFASTIPVGHRNMPISLEVVELQDVSELGTGSDRLPRANRQKAFRADRPLVVR